MKLQTLLSFFAGVLSVSVSLAAAKPPDAKADLEAAEELVYLNCQWGEDWNATLYALEEVIYHDHSIPNDDPQFLAVAEGKSLYREQVIRCGTSHEKWYTAAMAVARNSSDSSGKDIVDAAQRSRDSKCLWGAEWNATLASVVQTYYPDSDLPFHDSHILPELQGKAEFKAQLKACDSAKDEFNAEASKYPDALASTNKSSSSSSPAQTVEDSARARSRPLAACRSSACCVGLNDLNEWTPNARIVSTLTYCIIYSPS
ncbi:hypothetical protein EXIGLDRAFT_175318 [Exidia glandulosa HHB12029]|uniref:Uncharacterized protein n=1 Tax=Exidia glandulosa HHB12029 TaxID=1314781 RepID=A0A165F5T5_EXIGL|nr:hypothetical protein EXIGLDRAFT_175318 [Exidia glandulosa HHB12029]